VKVYASGSFAQGGKANRQFTVEELKAITEEAHFAGLKVAAHAYGEEALANSIEAGVDSIEHGIGLTSELAQRIHDKEIFYVPTLSAYPAMKPTTNQERNKLTKRHLTEDMHIAKGFHLKVLAGSDYVDCDTEPHGENYREIVNLAMHRGMRKR
jgi:imidazolonepropionase-like amidohydrolase